MVSQNIPTILEKNTTLRFDCIDRMYMNHYCPLIQTGGGAAYFFKNIRNMPVPSSTLMKQMTDVYLKATDEFIKRHQIEKIRFEPKQRKDDITQEKLSLHNGSEGVLYVGVAQEKVKTLRSKACVNDQTGKSYSWLDSSTAYVNQYYWYIFDEDFGPLFYKQSSYFPYTARLCINGHEYVKRQLEKRGITYEALDNGIYSCEQPGVLAEIANTITSERIEKLLEKWKSILPNPFTQADYDNGLRQEISMLQTEFASTNVFDKPINGRILFENIIKENIQLGRPENMSLIFDRRITKRTPGQFSTRIVTHGVTPAISAHYKTSRIKQYFKEQKALRTETVVNNTRDLKTGRKLENLDKLKSAAFAMNERLINFEKISQDCMQGYQVMSELSQPTQKNNQRASGLKFADVRTMALLHALCMAYILLGEFSNRELRQWVAQFLHLKFDDYTQNQMTYDLRRLVMHGIIVKIKGRNKYQLTEQGIGISLYYTKVHENLFLPSIAEITDDFPELKNRKVKSALKQFEKIIGEQRDALKISA